MKSNIVFLGGVLLALLFSGCATKNSLKNPGGYGQKSQLSFNIDSNKKVIQVTNSSGDINLGSFYPYFYKYNTRIVECQGYVFNLVPSDKCQTDGEYRKYIGNGTSKGILESIGFNTIGLITGIPIITLGLFSDYGYFDWDTYYTDIDSAWNKTGVNRKTLITRYDELLDVHNSFVALYSQNVNNNNNNIKSLNSKHIKNINTIYNKYKENNTYNLVDKTKLYKLKRSIDFTPYISRLKLPNINIQTPQYHSQKYKKLSVTCEPTKCLDYLDNEIKNEKQYYSSLLEKETNKIETLIKNTQQNQQEEVKKVKALHNSYTITSKTELQTKYDTLFHIEVSKTKKPLVVIDSVNFEDIYPTYSNEDKNLKITFDAKDNIVYENKTNEFIELKSVSIYYNNAVISNDYKERDNDAYNYEISPDSKLITHITEMAKYKGLKEEAVYKKLTKEIAKKTAIKFGFAVKYTIGNTTKNHSLYKSKKYNLLKVLENKFNTKL